MKTAHTQTGTDNRVQIDTSKMSEGQRAAMELTESARDADLEGKGFAGELFMGHAHFGQMFPWNGQSEEDQDQGDAFLHRLEDFLKANVDPDDIDRTGEIPDGVFEGLAKLGAFGIKIPRRYGGLGLSQTNYCRAAMLLGSYCGNLTALLSAHQSIGVPQPLLIFGTEEQKRRYLPRVAKGEISAFALTEVKVGSDPARMETHAEPSQDGEHFILNGEKLWCTNGTKAGVIVVMAKTPPKVVNGKPRSQVTAFLVEMDMPGVEVVRRCHFMGLRALYNGVIRFTDVKVPKANIIDQEGKGLRVALTTLNTGRLTLPAACVGLTKRCLEICREWALEREQWGAPIGKHAAIADKVARMASHVFAMEAMTIYTAGLVDRDKHADIRLEAAMCKMWGTEMAWKFVDETMQVRGGRGYETVQSLAARGEKAEPVERFMRDCRINTVFEGSSEIMRLFIAREALDPHLRVGAAVLNSQLGMATRAKAAWNAGLHYARWYPMRWLGGFFPVSLDGIEPRLKRHLGYVRKMSRRLSRALFHSMLKHGPALEKRQLLLGRLVDIATELFALTAACARAQEMIKGRNPLERGDLFDLVDCFAGYSHQRIADAFRNLNTRVDARGYKVAQGLYRSHYNWLADGSINHIRDRRFLENLRHVHHRDEVVEN